MQELETPSRTLPVAVKFTTVETPTNAPTNLIAWLPIVWSRVLFGGPHAAPSPLTWPAFALLFVTSGVLLYPCMSVQLFEPDEVRYGQISREMLTANKWIVPTLQGEPYLD